MPKKTTKKMNIAVESKKQGYWVNQDNLRKGERTIETKGKRHLVKRNRSGYEYDKTITGFEWSKAELQKKLAERAKKGMVEQAAVAKDLSKTHRITKTAPLITAKGFFSREKWNKQDVLGVDTPPGMSLSEIQKIYKNEKKPKTKTTKTPIAEKVLLDSLWILIRRSGDKGISIEESMKLSKLSKKDTEKLLLKLLASGDIYEFARHKFKSIGIRDVEEVSEQLVDDLKPAKPPAKKPITKPTSQPTSTTIDSLKKQLSTISNEFWVIQEKVNAIHTKQSEFAYLAREASKRKDREEYNFYNGKYKELDKEVKQLIKQKDKLGTKKIQIMEKIDVAKIKENKKIIDKEVPEKVQELFKIEAEADMERAFEQGIYFDSTRISAFSPAGKGFAFDESTLHKISVEKIDELVKNVEYLNEDFIALQSDDGQVHSLYSYDDFLGPYLKEAKKMGIIEILIAEEQPIVIKTKKGNFYIAPRIVEADDFEEGDDYPKQTTKTSESFIDQQDRLEKKKTNYGIMNEAIPEALHKVFDITITDETDVKFLIDAHYHEGTKSYITSKKDIGFSSINDISIQERVQELFGDDRASIPLEEIAQAVTMKKGDLGWDQAVALKGDDDSVNFYDLDYLKKTFTAAKKLGIQDVIVSDISSVLSFITPEGLIFVSPKVKEGMTYAERDKTRSEQVTKRKKNVRTPKKVEVIPETRLAASKPKGRLVLTDVLARYSDLVLREDVAEGVRSRLSYQASPRTKAEMLKMLENAEIDLKDVEIVDKRTSASQIATDFTTNPYLELQQKYEPKIKASKSQAEKSRLYDQWEDEKDLLHREFEKDVTKKQLEAKTIRADISEIDKETARRAYTWTSHSPDERGESDRKRYETHVNEFIDELYAALPPEKRDELNESLMNYKDKYKAKFLEQLHRQSGLASAAITGRSNFPVSQQRKKSDVYERKQKEFYEWDAKVKNAIRRQFGLAGGKGISSDDPEAIQKIAKKVIKLKANQARMKTVNKIVKSKSKSDNVKRKDLKQLGYDEQVIDNWLKGDFAGRIGFPGYELSNNLANIKRLEGRKKLLEEQRSQSTSTEEFQDVRIEDNVEANRLRIYFDDIPSEEIRSKLKSSGFRWTPSIKAWQRNRSERAEYLAKEIVEDYNKETKKDEKIVADMTALSKAESVTDILKTVDEQIKTSLDEEREPSKKELKKLILSKTNLTEKELDGLVKDKLAELGEFVTEIGALNIIDREKDREKEAKQTKESPERIDISGMTPKEVRIALDGEREPSKIDTLEEIDQAKKLRKSIQNEINTFAERHDWDKATIEERSELRKKSMVLHDEEEELRKAINKAEGVPETSKERAKALRDYLKDEFKKRYGKTAKFSVVKGTGTVHSWTQITGSADQYGGFTKEETELLEDVLKGESIQGSNYLPMDATRVEEHIRRITREKLKKK